VQLRYLPAYSHCADKALPLQNNIERERERERENIYCKHLGGNT